ncbi:hypothetical protein DFJ73DRAFT_757604 [Zopfochytrium polystomum]|nr:hypothetical protein DFJ73DRAFT_757604 [Zopfochytrium polystomum]
MTRTWPSCRSKTGHTPTPSIFSPSTLAPPPGADNGLLNGSNKDNDAGSNYTATVIPSTIYRLRVINSGVYAHMKFSIDNHTFQAIAADLTADNYWIRANPQLSCTNNKNQNGIKDILKYSRLEPHDGPNDDGAKLYINGVTHLARVTGTFSGKFTDYLTTAVPRRDVVVHPASGYLAVAFPLENPGTWLHCTSPSTPSRACRCSSSSSTTTYGAMSAWTARGIRRAQIGSRRPFYIWPAPVPPRRKKEDDGNEHEPTDPPIIV